MVSKAEKLLERMRQSKSGWKRVDVDRVYEHYGFRIGGGTKHDKYYHPDYPQLIAFVPRSRKVAEYIIRQLIRNIEKLEQLRSLEETSEAEQEEPDNE